MYKGFILSFLMVFSLSVVQAQQSSVADDIRFIENGDRESQYQLGMKYLKDNNNQDLTYAFFWLRKAAEKGHAKAQLNLGLMYDQGLGVKRDVREAFIWYRKAARPIFGGNLAEAQRHLARKYEKGEGTLQNKSRASRWYNRAAKQGDSEAQYRVAMGHLRDAIRRETEGSNVDFIKRSNEEAFRWFERAARQGHAKAQYQLGIMYWEKSYREKAVSWLKESASQGHVLAQYRLSVIYEKGGRRVRNLELAFRWRQKAAEQGHAEAQYELGEFYSHGFQYSDKDSVRWYRKAAEQGHTKAQYQLAMRAIKRNNYEEAVSWLKEAAFQGHSKAQYKLGYLYEKGEGVPKDLVMAHAWMDISSYIWIAVGLTSSGNTWSDIADKTKAKGRDRVAESMSKSELAEAKTKSQELVEKIIQNEELAAESKDADTEFEDNCSRTFRI